jgi:hypothetical protein
VRYRSVHGQGHPAVPSARNGWDDVATMTREPVLPAVRAAMFTAVCLGLGVAAHRYMSNDAIPPWAIVLGGIGVYTPARLGARQERGLLEITLLMGVLQVVLHLLFSYAQDIEATAACCLGMSSSMPGMAMPAGSSMSSMPGMTMPMSGAGGGMRMSAGMLAGHALAALVCAWWLRRGEAAVHALVRVAAHWIVAHFPVPVHVVAVPVHERPVLRCAPLALVLRSRWLWSSRTLRGPPISPSFT